MSLLGRVGFLIRHAFSSVLADSAAPEGGRGRSRARADAHDAAGAASSARTAETGADRSAPANLVQDPALASLYANLELPYGADASAVRNARRRLLRRYHPDLHSANREARRTATLVAQGLNHAHDELVRRLSRKEQ
ncbi:MAG: hypothetical protein O3A25_09825 [Acidobacteria bacterium]|nr:hypothetical protein [Acidobacteriota bacterium]